MSKHGVETSHRAWHLKRHTWECLPTRDRFQPWWCGRTAFEGRRLCRSRGSLSKEEEEEPEEALDEELLEQGVESGDEADVGAAGAAGEGAEEESAQT